MGNRAVITTSRELRVEHSGDLGIYLHWNGGRDSVEAFLTYCKVRGFSSPDEDNYGWTYLATVISNFFGGGLSVEIDKCYNMDCDNGDNGVYVIELWNIVDRKFFTGLEQNVYDLADMMVRIDESQPENQQMGEAKIRAEVEKLKGCASE